MCSVTDLDDRDHKAELILVRTCADLPTRQARKQFCKELHVPWEEYQRLKRKYSRILEIYKRKRRFTDGIHSKD